MSGRAGLTSEQIARFGITDGELADLKEHDPNKEGDITMPRTPLPADATREQKLAALPKLAGASGNPAYEGVLGRLAETAVAKLGEVEDALEDLADEFAIRFQADDERAAARDRISRRLRPPARSQAERGRSGRHHGGG